MLLVNISIRHLRSHADMSGSLLVPCGSVNCQAVRPVATFVGVSRADPGDPESDDQPQPPAGHLLHLAA
jgi:hypothetical protein